MQEGEGKELPFRVVFASSFCGHNLPENITSTSAYGEGWISAPGCKLPQEIILDFGNLVCINGLKIISHQTKIPAKIEIYAASDEATWSQSKYIFVTDTEFTDNKERNYKAREMREAEIPTVKARYMKLIIQSVHQNEYNPENQIGIISINAIGVQDKSNSDDYLTDLEEEKRIAISSQDFERASELKRQIDYYKANKSKIDRLTNMMNEAAERDDFEVAQKCKTQILEIKTQASISPSRFSSPKSYNQDPYPQNQYSQYDSHNQQHSFNQLQSSYNQQPPSWNQPSEYPTEITQSPRIDQSDMQQPSIMDEDIIDRKRRMAELNATRPIRPARGSSLLPPDGPSENGGELPPDPLTEESAAAAGPLLDVAGEMACAMFFSKAPPVRVNGTKKISDAILKADPEKHADLYAYFLSLLRSRLADKAPNPFVKILNEVVRLSQNLMLPPGLVRSQVEPFVRPAFSRMGVSHPQQRRQCVMFIRFVALSDFGLPFVLPSLLSEAQKDRATVQQRLQILAEVVTERAPELDIPAVAKFAVSLLDDAKAEVRAAATEVLRAVVDGPSRGPDSEQLVERLLSRSGLPPITLRSVRDVVFSKKD